MTKKKSLKSFFKNKFWSGISPGSMPPHSKSLADEGAAFKSFLLVDGGKFSEAEIVKQLTTPTGTASCGELFKIQLNLFLWPLFTFWSVPIKKCRNFIRLETAWLVFKIHDAVALISILHYFISFKSFQNF